MPETVGINVVFTDLVGSTEMSNRLGPEKTEDLRVVHFGLLRAATEANAGREVKNLGDGLMIVFPSLGAALDGSVAMQQAIDRHNSSGKEPLGVRVGIATGDATEENDDYFGEPVVEAARLCAKCEAGQIIVSQLTSMIARNSGHSFTSIGDLELRGVPEPVPAMTVDWEALAIEADMPIPDRLTPDMDLQLAGREAERTAMAQAFKDTESGARRVTFLAGEPGIGKTRLGSELAAEVFGRGALTLYGRCDEELSLPYQPWVEAVSYVFEHGSDEFLGDVVRLHGPELALLVPQIRRRFPDMPAPQSSDPETERYLLLQAVTSLLAMLSADTPVLLVLDDLHWADKQTLTLLRHVFTNLSSASLMIVGTYRDSDLETGHPLIDTVAALRREPGVEQLPIRGLDDIEMIQLVQISAGHELDDTATSMALSLRQETAGNPFFAHEILRNLVEVGDLYVGDDNQWIIKKSFDDLALPQSVRDVVGQRIARLGEESLKALRAAAVIGKEFDLELLAEVTDTDEDDLLDLLEAAITAGILAEVPGGEERYRFLHTVARNTLQSDLSDGRKRRMHRKVAEALEASIGSKPGGRVTELATHWMAAAAPVDGTKAIEYARMAGQHAQASLAPDEAIRWFTTAIEHLELTDEPEEDLHAQLLVDLGSAQLHAGEAAYRQTLLDAAARARAIGNTRLLVDAALANNRGMYSKLGERDDERVDVLEAAIEAVGTEHTAERALLLATLFSELEYGSSFDVRQALIGEALEIARELGDEWVLATILNRSCITSAAPHTLEARLAASAESLEIARRLKDPTLEFWARCGGFQAALTHFDVSAAETLLDELAAGAAEIGRPSFHWIAAILRCAFIGATEGGGLVEEQAATALTIGSDANEPDAFDYYAADLMMARWLQGRSVEILDQLLEVAAANPEVPAYLGTAAMFLAEEGHDERARELITGFAENGFDLRVNGTWLIGTVSLGRAAAITDDAVHAEALYDLLAPWAGQAGVSQSLFTISVDGTLGGLATVLERYDDAEAHFVAAEALTHEAGVTHCAAVDDVLRARLHLRRGTPESARMYAGRALEAARSNNFDGIERRATVLLEDSASS